MVHAASRYFRASAQLILLFGNRLKYLLMKLYVKYMVSIRCKLMVKDVLKQLGLHYVVVNLGEIDILEELTAAQRELLREALLKSGLELMDEKKAILIERIKNIIIEMVHYSESPLRINFSVYLAEKMHYDYTYLANLFSEVVGSTIEHFIIAHKIERVKELIVYDELNLTQISYLLNYSSVAHLSNQFKKVTGLTPSHFKKLKLKRQGGLEEI
jgi:YesN/AraC family two-component response regulator